MANAKTVNWSALDQDTLFSYFYSLRSKVVGKSLTPDQIQRLISKHVKPVLPIRIKKCIDPKIEQSYIYTGGMYHSYDDMKGRASIEVNFSYHPGDERLRLTDYRWKKLSKRFADVILHEIIHMRQFRARGFKALPGYQSTAASGKERKSQEYFGDTDEMGAFAFNIAQQMINQFGYDPASIKHYLDSNDARRRKTSWWYDYLNTFDWNHDHKIIRRMKRKILTQLENAYIGKPFKTTDWLTY